MKTVLERVLAKTEIIPECGCWIFMGQLNKQGYGRIGRGGRNGGLAFTHRITYQYLVKDIPYGMHVLHKCDVPSCCNPHHLFVGTDADNNADMISKGRAVYVRGEQQGIAILTEQLVRQMRASRLAGESVKSIAQRLSIKYHTAHKAIVGINWKHVC